MSSILNQYGKPFPKTPVNRFQLGERGRVSVNDPSRIEFGMTNIITPDNNGNLRMSSFNYSQLRALPLSQQIAYIIKSSTELSSAVEIYQNNIAPDFTLTPAEGTPQSTLDQLKFFIDERLGGKAMLMDTARQCSYYSFAEGAVAIEVSNDLEGYPSEISAVAPLSLSFRKQKDEQGEWWQIGQRSIVGNEFTLLYDYRTPNEGVSRYFRYVRTNITGNEPYGSSRVAPALFSIASIKTLIDTLVDFTKGQVFPKHIYHVDLDALEGYGYDSDEIKKAAETATQLLQGKLSAADITQDVVLDTPIVAVLVGAMSRANIDGSEMIKEILENNINRQFRIPGYLFGIARRGGGLNDKESEFAWLGFRKDLVPYRKSVDYCLEYGLNLIIAELGLPGNIIFSLNDEDSQEHRLKAESFKTSLEAWQIALEMGIVSRQEVRTRMIAKDFDFSDMEADLPEDAVPIPRSSRVMPESTNMDVLGSPSPNGNHHRGEFNGQLPTQNAERAFGRNA